MKAIKCVLVLAIVMTTAADCRAVDEPTAMEKTNKQLVVTGNNKFALELYAKLRSKKGNLFFSPYSISTALAMTHAGARGQTEAQMAGVLHFPIIAKSGTELSSKIIPDRHQFASAFAEIIKDLNNRGEKGGYELRVANALWGQKGYGFLEEFLELIKTYYGGRLNEVDFVRATETARKTINAWVEKNHTATNQERINQALIIPSIWALALAQ